MRRHAIVPRVRRTGSTSRHNVFLERGGTMLSCRVCDGSAALACIASLSSVAAPGHRAECATGQQHQQARFLFRAMGHRASVPFGFTYSAAIGRCDGPAAPADATSLSSSAEPCYRADCSVAIRLCAAGPAAAGELRGRAVAPEAGLWRVGTCLPAQCRRCPGGAPAGSCRFADAGSSLVARCFCGTRAGCTGAPCCRWSGREGPPHWRRLCASAVPGHATSVPRGSQVGGSSGHSRPVPGIPHGPLPVADGSR